MCVCVCVIISSLPLPLTSCCSKFVVAKICGGNKKKIFFLNEYLINGNDKQPREKKIFLLRKEDINFNQTRTKIINFLIINILPATTTTTAKTTTKT